MNVKPHPRLLRPAGQGAGHRDVVTVVGHATTIAAGEWITASGDWVNDRTVMLQGNLLYTGVKRDAIARRDRADSRRKARGSETQCC
jgi:hypothetical protein